MWDGLGKAADVASLVSLGVSIYAACQITEVRRKIAFDARAGEKITEIEGFLTWFANNSSGFPANEREMTFRVDQCVAWLDRIRKFMPRDVRDRIKDIHKTRKQYVGTGDDNTGRDFLWTLRDQVDVVLSLVKDTVEDRRIGGYGGSE